ncbi:MAG: hypothetical protein Q9183_000847 [Haloplaca sp. 2 TL-2023]
MSSEEGQLGRTSMETTFKSFYNLNIDRLRQDEYPMLNDTVYLDHAGTTLYPRSLIQQSSKDLTENVFGNPHSRSSSSQLSTQRIEDVRLRALHFFNADPEQFDLVFVANATAGIKLVMEGFREQVRGFWYGYHGESHTSLIGVRENAAQHHCFASDDEVEAWLQDVTALETGLHQNITGLFAYPAQSNLTGRRLPLSWLRQVRSRCNASNGKAYTLLDAAALVSTSPLDLGDTSLAPDFTVLSFYKIFGFPDLGALIVRKESSLPLRSRRYFGGGTVEMATCMNESWHVKKQDSIHEQLEDGTLPIHSIIALDSAFAIHHRLFDSMEHVSKHTSHLAHMLHEALSSLHHANGLPVCTVYEDSRSSYKDSQTQGPIIALNLRNSKGEWVSNGDVEKLAAIRNIHLRTGGLCNPGGVASLLNLSPWEMRRNFAAGQRCGNEDDVFQGKPTGIIRVSLGAMSNMQDVRAFVHFVEEFFMEQGSSSQSKVCPVRVDTRFHISSLAIYPIKSCGAWQVPPTQRWNIRAEGLAWDREWCLVHQGTRAALSQKRIPRMALIRPELDFDTGVMRIRFDGHLPPSIPDVITITLFPETLPFERSSEYVKTCSSSKVCGDSFRAQIHASPQIAAFFTAALSTPCTLARFPPGPSSRHSKFHLKTPKPPYHSILPTSEPTIPGAFPTPPPSPPSGSSPSGPSPILLSNESPILTISQSSLGHLNKIIKQTSPSTKPILASVFRANIVLAQSSPGPEIPYDEDNWSGFRMVDSTDDTPDSKQVKKTSLQILAPCRRCQMVCIDQDTAETSQEPFSTLAKTRRLDVKEQGGQKGVFFGVHCALEMDREQIGEGDGTVGATIGIGDSVVPVRKEMGEEGVEAGSL